MSESIELGGARYAVVKRPTLRQEVYIGALARRAGVIDPMPAAGEDPEAFATRVVMQANEAGVLFDLLGATLMPAGVAEKDWTPGIAEAIALQLGDLQDEKDKQRARQLIAEALVPFMRAGLASFTRTPGASPGAAASAGETVGSPGSSPSTAGGTQASG